MTISNLSIIRTKDYKLIAKLNKAVQDHHYKMYPNFFKEYSRAEVTDFFSKIIDVESYHFYVSYSESTPVGFIWFEEKIAMENPFTKPTDKLYVHMMSINDSERGKGFGKLLLESVFDYAREKNISRVELDYWMKNNMAKEFYRTLGFKVRKETAYIDL